MSLTKYLAILIILLLSSTAFSQYYPSGNVRGPTSSTNNDFVGFSGTTGKIIKDLGYGATAFAAASHTQAFSTITGVASSSQIPLATTSAPGGITTLSNSASDFLNGKGLWAVPAGGSGGSGGRGAYSAIVYQDGSKLYAKTPDGLTTIAFETKGVDDGEVIRYAVAYAYQNGGGDVYVTQNSYTTDEPIIAYPGVHIIIEAGTTIEPSANVDVMRVYSQGSITCDGEYFNINIPNGVTWSSSAINISSEYKTIGDDGTSVHVEGFRLFGQLGDHGTGLKFFSSSSAANITDGQNNMYGPCVSRGYIYGFNRSIYFKSTLNSALGPTAQPFVNGATVEKIFLVSWRYGIVMESAYSPAGHIEGNTLKGIQLEHSSYKVIPIYICGAYNYIEAPYWDNNPKTQTVWFKPHDVVWNAPEHNTVIGLGQYASPTFNHALGVDSNIIYNPTVTGSNSTSVAGTYTVMYYDNVIACNSTAGVQTIVIPRCEDHWGRDLTIVKTTASGNAVTISGTNYIDGAATKVLAGGAVGSVTLHPYLIAGSYYWAST